MYTRINPDTGVREFSTCKTIQLIYDHDDLKVGQWVSNPDAELIAAEDWVEYIPPAPSPAELLERAKANKVSDLEAYDSSEDVNGFIYGGNTMWIMPSDRTNYLNTMQGAQRLGIETVPFMGHNIAVSDAIRILDAISIYAMQCVAVTDTHRAAINALSTIEEVETYDFRVGYPPMLNFDNLL